MMHLSECVPCIQDFVLLRLPSSARKAPYYDMFESTASMVRLQCAIDQHELTLRKP